MLKLFYLNRIESLHCIVQIFLQNFHSFLQSFNLLCFPSKLIRQLVNFILKLLVAVLLDAKQMVRTEAVCLSFLKFV